MLSWPSASLPALPGRGPELRLYDSSDRQVRPVAAGPTANMYVCGITSYVATAPYTAPGAKRADGDGVIKVRGLDDLMVYRAKCCNPIRGEAIVGYVTRGKGVAVHAKMCPNVQSLLYDVERKIEVEWARAADDSFPVRIVIHTDDRPGMLN